jgi:uncharacterized membrane protein YkvA (DUF1232 family)
MQHSDEDKKMAEATLMEEPKTGLGRSLWQQARLVMRLMSDSDVPIWLKAMPVAAMAYVLMPFDFAPDVIPVLGQMDDLGIFVVGMKMFVDLAPITAVNKHLSAIREADGYGYLNDNMDDVNDDGSFIIDGEIINEKSPDDLK